MSDGFSFGDLRTHNQKKRAGEVYEEPEWVKETPEETVEKAVTELMSKPERRIFDDYYHPSRIHDMCPVAEFWLRIRRPPVLIEEPNLPLSLMAAAGTQAHNFFQDRVLGPAGILWGSWECPKCGAEFEKTFLPGKCPECSCNRLQYLEPQVLSHEHKIRGHSDGIIRIPSLDDMILEMKSKSRNTWEKTHAPNARERTQASIYMELLGVDKCVYLFICRDDYRYRAVIEDKREDLVENAFRTIDAIEECVAAGEPDPVIMCQRKCSRKSTTRARECPFREECWSFKK